MQNNPAKRQPYETGKQIKRDCLPCDDRQAFFVCKDRSRRQHLFVLALTLLAD